MLLATSMHTALGQTTGTVLVSEVLFNPEPNGTDYVELYNASDNVIPLEGLRLARMVGDSVARLYKIADSGSMEPHSLMVVTTDAGYVSSHYTVTHPEWMIEVSQMPPYNDASGTVAVCTTDTVMLDRFDYDAKMHSRLLRDVEGVALERRSYQVAADVPTNWYSAASTAGFGTPTGRNSQSHEFLFVDNDFATDKSLFSPDGDGYNDLLDINYSLTQCDLSANLSIADAQGRTLRHANGVLLGCQGTLTWDGTDDSGSPCPRGKYLVVIEVYNISGTSQRWRQTVSLVRK